MTTVNEARMPVIGSRLPRLARTVEVPTGNGCRTAACTLSLRHRAAYGLRRIEATPAALPSRRLRRPFAGHVIVKAVPPPAPGLVGESPHAFNNKSRK